jgi:hypothetical protein
LAPDATECAASQWPTWPKSHSTANPTARTEAGTIYADALVALRAAEAPEAERAAKRLGELDRTRGQP